MSGEVPTRIAHFRLESLVGEGGVGIVYRAIDDTLGRTVALKVLGDPEMAEGLIDEARNVSSLNHPSIAGVFEAGVCAETGLAFVAFEWVPGSSLRAMLREGPLTNEKLLAYGRELAAAVTHAHESGLVHGDLKADNVVVGRNDRVKLLDFGLAAPLGGIDDGELWGTPACMAPELLAGGSRSERSDLFALGVLLYEMATGKLPFGGEDGDDDRVRKRQAEGPAADPREHRPELSSGLAELIQRMIELEPEKRGPSVAEVERRLRLEQRRGVRSVLPIVIGILVLLAVPVAWATRDRWFPDNSEVKNQLLEFPTWQSLDSGPDRESEFGSDLLQLLVHGDDPGSSLLSVDESRVPCPGRWGRRDGGWVAEWDWGSKRGVEAGDPVALAHAVLDVLHDAGAQVERARTLCDDEKALRGFVDALHATEAATLAQALRMLEEVRDRGPRFPEAEAWQATLGVVLSHSAAAVRVPGTLGDIPSQPARTLAAHFIDSPPQRGARWGAKHGVARQLDGLLDLADATTPDSEVELLLLEELPILAMPAALEFLLAHDRVDEARGLIDRYHARVRVGWRRALFLHGVERAGGRPFDVQGWLLDGANAGEDPAGIRHLRMCYDLGRRSRDAFDHAHADGPADAQSTSLLLAASGRFTLALEVASGIYDPFDPARTYRVRAAVQALAGYPGLALEDLERAQRLDPDNPRTPVLIGFLDESPRESWDPVPASRFARWRRPYESYSQGRHERRTGNAAAALETLEQIAWVDWQVQPVSWPELPYLAWLERIQCWVDQDDMDRARSEMYVFRRWWPEDRPENSRVSRRALEVDGLLGD